MYLALSKSIRMLAQGMALLGGISLLVIVVLTIISIVGRIFVPLDIGIGPIRGIYDYTEFGVAAAVFAFLPWCQLQRGHASVDLFKIAFPNTMNRIIDVVMDTGLLVVAVLIAWRLYLGMSDKMSYGETTLIAQVPVWQGYAMSLVGAVVFAIVAAFCVLRSARAALGMSKLPGEDYAA